MQKLNIFIRSAIFNIMFLIASIIFSISALLMLFMPSIYTLKVAKIWSKSSLWLLKHICHLDYKITGLENIPQNTHVVFASKHQSAWETVAYQTFLHPSVFMFKKELAFIPLFGIALLKAKNIPINRGHANKGMIKDLTNKFKDRLKNQNIIIFPEGTRTKPNTPANYKSGLSLITENIKTFVVPIAMNSGIYWPKKSFLKYPGTIQVHILPPIETGSMSHLDFQKKFVGIVEDEMKRL